MVIDKIPERFFEWAGLSVGIIGPILILSQIRAELTNPVPSTLSPLYLTGFLIVYFFWFLYGVRFRRVAVWMGNLLGTILQVLLLVIVLLK